MPSNNPYRILCLDGGGRWSLISVMALQKIFGERARGYDILASFDLVAANSGGSIVLGQTPSTSKRHTKMLALLPHNAPATSISPRQRVLGKRSSAIVLERFTVLLDIRPGPFCFYR
jgi:hypothetical protein